MLKAPTMSMLNECGINVQPGYYAFLSEAAKVQVTDSVLTDMFKFITDKYNSLDFNEIERSAGDYNKFKYTSLIRENTDTLSKIYLESSDPGAKKYVEVTEAIRKVDKYLVDRANEISYLYKKNVGLVQVLYTTMVAGMLYALTALVTNTIRFVTSEQDTDMEVLFDEIPGSIRQVHIRNIVTLANDLNTVDQLITTLYRQYKNGGGKLSNSVNEAAAETLAIATLAVAGVIYLIPKVIVLIREIIYSIYFARVRTAEALDIQVQLIRTNIESLEAGRGNKKVIARQKAIADKLERYKNKISVKMDAADSLSKVQQKKENAVIGIAKDSELSSDSTGGLML